MVTSNMGIKYDSQYLKEPNIINKWTAFRMSLAIKSLKN